MNNEQKLGVAVILKAQKERKKNFSLSELKILIWGGGNEFLTALFVNGRFAKKKKNQNRNALKQIQKGR